MKKLTAVILTVTAVLSSGAAVTEKPDVYRKEILKNRFIELEFLPESLGRLNQIKLNSSGRKLLLERTLTKVSVDPLYEFYRNNTFGCGENFWKNYVAQRDGKSRVSVPEDGSILFENKWYGGLPIDLRRKTTLLPESTIWLYEAEVFNRGQKPFYLAVWYSLTPDNAANTILQIPAAGKINKHVLGNLHILDRDAVISQKIGLFAPKRNWIATVYPDEKAVLAIIAPPEEFFPDGAFYSWYGEDNRIKYRSMEIILNGKNIAPGQKTSVKCMFAVFLNLDGIKDVAGVTAVNVKKDGKKATLILAPARKTAAGEMIVYSGEKQYKVTVPVLYPGENHQIEIDDCGPISGILPDGSKFDLQ
ncbi:MAG: hypothetical protein E7047_01740 [Lentisphaerae bacterium]|nr:hypothetical protein [Lentisphaerota bacterium]